MRVFFYLNGRRVARGKLLLSATKRDATDDIVLFRGKGDSFMPSLCVGMLVGLSSVAEADAPPSTAEIISVDFLGGKTPAESFERLAWAPGVAVPTGAAFRSFFLRAIPVR